MFVTLHLLSLKYEIFALKENMNVLTCWKTFIFQVYKIMCPSSTRFFFPKSDLVFLQIKGNIQKHLSCIFQIWLYNAIICEEQNIRVWVNLLNSTMGVWRISVSEKQAIYWANTDASCSFCTVTIQFIIINHTAPVNDDKCTSFTQQHKQLDPVWWN